jgi:hypothetical protein
MMMDADDHDLYDFFGCRYTAHQWKRRVESKHPDTTVRFTRYENHGDCLNAKIVAYNDDNQIIGVWFITANNGVVY